MPRGVYLHKPNQGFQKGVKKPPFSEEHIRKLREARKRQGSNVWNKGKKGLQKHTQEWKDNAKERMKGNQFRKGYTAWNKGLQKEKNPLWIEDRSLLKTYSGSEERRSPKYQNWRHQCIKRDRHICRINNKDCEGKVVVHHILGWADYPELRYNINNGITLCQAHHPLKRAEEKRLIPFFSGLVPVSNEII